MTDHKHDTSKLPPPLPSEQDTGKVRTGIDALGQYVAAVDFLTGEVSGLASIVANLPDAEAIRKACALGAAEGVANAVIELATRVEANERKLAAFEIACESCRTLQGPRLPAGFSLRPDHVSVRISEKLRYKGKGAFALAAIFVLSAAWVAVRVVESPKSTATTTETRKTPTP